MNCLRLQQSETCSTAKNITEISRGETRIHKSILEGSCRLVEQASGSLAISLLTESYYTTCRSSEFSQNTTLAEVDGVTLIRMGTFSAAAARNEPVSTRILPKSAHGQAILDLAPEHGLKAGWATPVFSSDEQVRGHLVPRLA